MKICDDTSFIINPAQSIWSEIYLKRNWKIFFPLKYAISSFEECLNY